MTDKAELARRVERGSTKILLVGDLHLMDKPPRNATETYTQDVFDLLDVTAKLEKALNLDAVVWAGDVFHHKQPSRTSHNLVLRTIEAVKKYRRLLIVTGNHDISNDRLESLDSQPLGVLFEAGAEELDGWAPGLPVFGVPWQQRWFEAGLLEEVFTDWRSSEDPGGSLVVTHASIFPPGEEPIFDSLHPADIAEAMRHQGSLYYGHIHEDHGVYEADGVTFANVGALSRGSLTEYNLERGIQACLWTPEDGFFPISLPAKPAAEVFRVEEAAEKKQHLLDDEKFLQDVGSTRLEISSVAGVIQVIQEMDLEEPVKRAAIELLELQDA